MEVLKSGQGIKLVLLYLYLPEYDLYLDPKNDFLINNINPQFGYSDIEKIHLVEAQNKIRVLVLNKDQLNWESIKILI